MLELADSGKDIRRVERYAMVALPRDTVVDGNIAKPEVVEAALREAWKAMATKTREVALALPAAAVITKKILLPPDASEADIETQVSAEANQMAPFPLDEVSLDYQILGPAPRNPNENEAIIVVSRRERVEERVALAEAVGLRAQIMDVDTFAALTAFEQIAFQLPDNGRNQTVAVVDIGANATHVCVVHDKQLVYQREHALGGYVLTQEIARRYDLSTDEAEDAKRKGLILLAGGCAAIPGLDDVVHSRMQTSTLIANPFAKMALSNQVKARQLAADAPALFVACGLAMRRFDAS